MNDSQQEVNKDQGHVDNEDKGQGQMYTQDNLSWHAKGIFICVRNFRSYLSPSSVCL